MSCWEKIDANANQILGSLGGYSSILSYADFI